MASCESSLYQVMGEGEEQGVVKIADFGLARIYQAPLKHLFENGVWYLILIFCKSCLSLGEFPLSLPTACEEFLTRISSVGNF